MSSFENTSARTAEQVSVTCPVCNATVLFRPIVQNVIIRNAHDVLNPHLIVGLQAGNIVPHTCVTTEDRNLHG
jgi:hypothetical protein